MAKKETTSKILRFPSDIDGMRGMYIQVWGVSFNQEYGADTPQGQLGSKIGSVATKAATVVGGASTGVLGDTTSILSGVDKSMSEFFKTNTDTTALGDATEEIGGAVGTFYQPVLKEYIFLPMPLDLSVNYNASWSGQNLGYIHASARKYLEGKTNEAGGIVNRGLVMSGLELGASLLPGGSQNVSTMHGLLGSAKKIMNPYKELMYDGPSLRMFKFDWTFSPKNRKEAEQLEKIIKVLKRTMHPQISQTKSAGGMIWEYPDYVDISFPTNIDARGEDTPKDQLSNPHLFSIKRCAISNINVRYDNKFHADGHPTAISVELQIMETQLLTQGDFDTDTISSF